ncbi:MAG: hypothetical protein IKO47_08010 [Ruminococcus sp.]|nr:hypothetical protein [Ruminococcus sp.]
MNDQKQKRISAAAVFLMIALSLFALVSCGGKKSSSKAPAPAEQTRSVQTSEDEILSAETGEQTASRVTTSKKKTTSKATTTRKQTTKKKKTTTKNTTTAAATTVSAKQTTAEKPTAAYVEYKFRNKKYLSEHFSKHGSEFADDFGYKTAAEYEKGASDVINNPDALFKYEAEDGDGVYYLEATNEFVILSTDGYIRTYFRPSGGRSYFDRQ